MKSTAIVGRGWAFPPTGSIRGTLFSLTNINNEIEQAIHIILQTQPGERVMRPAFGCRIHELIFEPNNRQTAALAERYVEEALTRWEPRIQLLHILAVPGFSYKDQHQKEPADTLRAQAELVIEIDYLVKSIDDKRSLVFPFYIIPFEAPPTPPTEKPNTKSIHSPISVSSI